MDPRTIKMLEERRAAAAEAASKPPPHPNTQATEWFQKNRTSVGTLGAAVVGLLLVGQYMLVTAPARRQEQQTQQTQADLDAARAMEEKLQTCLANADTTYTADVEKACRAKREGSNCSLNRVTAERIDQKRLDARIDCIKGYTPR
jgi:type II secretory pathway component PulM